MKSRLALWGQTGMIRLYHRGKTNASAFAANGGQRASKGHLRELKWEGARPALEQFQLVYTRT
jgi:hypothetical protein